MQSFYFPSQSNPDRQGRTAEGKYPEWPSICRCMYSRQWRLQASQVTRCYNSAHDYISSVHGTGAGYTNLNIVELTTILWKPISLTHIVVLYSKSIRTHFSIRSSSFFGSEANVQIGWFMSVLSFFRRLFAHEIGRFVWCFLPKTRSFVLVRKNSIFMPKNRFRLENSTFCSKKQFSALKWTKYRASSY
jgi:hypothetical protein